MEHRFALRLCVFEWFTQLNDLYQHALQVNTTKKKKEKER